MMILLNKKIQRNRGFVMLFAVVLSSIVLAITLGVLDIALKEIKFGTPAIQSNEASFAADTGVECALFNDKSTSNIFVPSGGASNIPCIGLNPPVFGSYPDFSFTLANFGANNRSCVDVQVNKNGFVTTVTAKGYNKGDSRGCGGIGAVEREYIAIVGGPASIITPPAGTNRSLNIALAGAGSGVVTSNPAGISCGSACSALFLDGTAVDLSAVPSPGESFTGWSGDCSGTGICSLVMDSNKSATATFALSAPLPSNFPTIAATNGGVEAVDTTSHTVQLPSSIAAGDLLVVFFAVDSNPTITWPAGWTRVLINSVVPASDQFEIRYRVATGTEGSSMSLTTSNVQKSAHQSFRMTGYTGVPVGASAVGNGNPSPDSPNLAPSWGLAKTMWIAAFGRGSGTNVTTVSVPASYTNSGSQSAGADGTGATVQTSWRTFETASENPSVFTLSGNNQWVAATIGIEGL